MSKPVTVRVVKRITPPGSNTPRTAARKVAGSHVLQYFESRGEGHLEIPGGISAIGEFDDRETLPAANLR